MQIRQKLTYQFVLIVTSIFMLSLLAIYFFSAQFRKTQFTGRLTSRAQEIARLIIDVKQVDTALLRIIERTNSSSLINENIAVFDKYNRLIYCNDTLDIKVTPELLEQVRKEKKIHFIEKDFEVIGIEYTGKKQKYVIIAGAENKYGLSKIKYLKTLLISVFFTGILIVFVLGWFFAGKALEPISKMVKQADKISISNIHLRLDEGNKKDELSILAQTFNNMLLRLENAIHLQKEFVANASHELRTPLTSIMGQLEVSLMRERNTEYYKAKISSVIEDIKALIQTSNQLLALTQVSSDESAIKFSPLRLDEIIIQSRSELIKRNPDFNIELHFNNLPSDEDKILVLSNEILLKTAFQNLLENGCKFSENKKVVWNIEFLEKIAKLQFYDEGIGIDPVDIEYIFQPFYRGSNAKKVKGSGIGLSIVERIIDLHKGKIEVSSVLNKFTTFIITLPTC